VPRAWPHVMEGLSTRGEARLGWIAGPRPGSRCFSRLEAAELEAEAEPLEVDTLDLVLAGEPLPVRSEEERTCECVAMTWSTPG